MMGIDMRSADEKQHAQYNTATKTLKNDLDVLQQPAQMLSRWVSTEDDDFYPSVHQLKKHQIILLVTGHPKDDEKINFKIQE